MRPLLPMGAPPADLRRRITAIRACISESEQKKARIDQALRLRRTTLQRLEAELAMSECAQSPAHDA